MSLLMLTMGLVISSRGYDKQRSSLDQLRALARAELGAAHAQIGVKLLEQEELSGGLLSTYLVVPCEVICGHDESCERLCQRQVMSWIPAQHSAPEARYLIVFEGLEGQQLGHFFRSATGQVRALSWLPREALLTVTHRTGEGCCESVLIYRGKEQSSTQDTSPAVMSLLVEHPLHSLSAFDSLGEPTLKVDDIDEDNSPEWHLYDPRFATLTPRPIKLTLPFQLDPEGLKLNKRMIRSLPPELNERRAWLIDLLQRAPSSDSPAPAGVSGALFEELLRLCIKGYCAEADELVALAYPQSELAQAFWDQLKRHIGPER